MKKRQAWVLPFAFLLGYLFAWGMILVDRQMLIEEQRRLREEINSAKIELKIKGMIEEYNEDFDSQIKWNREALEEPKSESNKEEKCSNLQK